MVKLTDLIKKGNGSAQATATASKQNAETQGGQVQNSESQNEKNKKVPNAFTSLKETLNNKQKPVEFKDVKFIDSGQGIKLTDFNSVSAPVQPAAEKAGGDVALPRLPVASNNPPAAISTPYSADELQDIKDSLHILHDAINHPEMVKDAIVNVMNKLQGNPALRDILLPEDYGMMVRALRTSYGVVIAKKNEKKEKTTEKQKSLQETLDMLSDFKIG